MRDRTAANMAVRLLEETVKGGVQWSITDVPRNIREGTGNVHPLFVETNFKGSRIALYEERYRHFIDEDNFYWSARVCMAVLDEADRVLWEVWDEPEINELYRVTREKVAGVGRLLNYFR